MERKATAYFTKEEKYFVTGPDNRRHDLVEGTGPYEYLMGALCGCFYSTLSDFEKKSTWDSVVVTATGTKRTVVPTTLEHATLELVAHNATDKEEFEELVKRTAANCSIYQTLSLVADIDIAVRFEDDEE